MALHDYANNASRAPSTDVTPTAIFPPLSFVHHAAQPRVLRRILPRFVRRSLRLSVKNLLDLPQPSVKIHPLPQRIYATSFDA